LLAHLQVGRSRTMVAFARPASDASQ
jgi:hypothetical protein